MCSCNSNNTVVDEAKETQKEELKTSEIVYEPANAYYYYLPSIYKTNTELPILIFFDAHAIGDLPLKKYKKLSEKFGYILIGSNKSENGLTENQYFSIYNNIKNDISKKFSFNKARIYTSGFSGGARVASMIAISEGGIIGVIACGAGFPQLNGENQNKFNFVGIAGNIDFNYTELKQLANYLDNQNYKNHFIGFNGKHEWPPDSVMLEAFYWLETNAMRDSLKPKNDSLISEIQTFYNKQFEMATDNTEKFKISETIISFLDGLTDIETIKKKNWELINKSDVKQYLKKETIDIESEITERNNYAKYLNENDLDWWKSEINKLNAKSDLKSARLLNYLSLMFFMSADGALKQNAIEEAAAILDLYKLADPENSDVYYLYACYYAIIGDAGAAKEQLNFAIEKGFNNWYKMKNDTRLSILRDTDLFLYH